MDIIKGYGFGDMLPMGGFGVWQEHKRWPDWYIPSQPEHTSVCKEAVIAARLKNRGVRPMFLNELQQTDFIVST